MNAEHIECSRGECVATSECTRMQTRVKCLCMLVEGAPDRMRHTLRMQPSVQHIKMHMNAAFHECVLGVMCVNAEDECNTYRMYEECVKR